MKLRFFSWLVLAFAWLGVAAGFAQDPKPATAPAPTPTIKAKVAGMEARPGFFPLYWDAKAGKLWLEIFRFDDDFLYSDSLPAGLGSNDIGLDRGQLGQERLVHFSRSGPKVLLMETNLAF